MDIFKLFPQFRLNIDNLSQLLNFSKSKIRFIEKEFYPFINPQRDSSRRRLYSEEDLKKFFIIKELTLKEGYSYSRVRYRLRKMDEGVSA